MKTHTDLKKEKDDIRNTFFRDVDRIIYSNSYTRYIDKTQVFSFQKNDHITHRVLHVQLVSKIARQIGRALKLNEDLIEAIALGHDLGHVPLGHVGERILNDICIENEIGYFCHNAQSVRQLMLLEKNGLGLNLNVQTLDGILAHNGEFVLEKYIPDTNKTKEQFLKEYNNCFEVDDYNKKIVPMTFEGCVVRLSDVIAYIGKDIEDAILLGVIKREDVPKNIVEILGDNNSQIVNTLILDIIKNSINKKEINFSKDVFEALKELKKFNLKNIYMVESDCQDEKVRPYFKKLFSKYVEMIEKQNIEDETLKEFVYMNDGKYLESTNAKRIAIDYISGQTDKFFHFQCKKYCDMN